MPVNKRISQRTMKASLVLIIH